MAEQDSSRQPPEDTTVERDGYQLTFYPGFASRCVVRSAEGKEIELYRQKEPFRLPQGQTKPRDRYRMQLRGGAQKQNVTFDVHDPERRVKRITVELYPESHVGGEPGPMREYETLTLDNDTICCPPYCDMETFESMRREQEL